LMLAGLETLLATLECLRPVFTRPGFENLLVIFVGWVLTAGPHAVTQSLVATSVAGRRHHEAFHRFFSRGTWSVDELGHHVFELVLKLVPAGPLRAAIDDTLAPKKGPEVFGIGSHLDAVRSTKKRKVFCFGHCWVTLTVLVRVPFSHRVWGLPVLFRLYRNKKECAAKGEPYRKKTELAREMLDVLVGWVGERRVEVSADSGYCNDTVMRSLPDTVVVFGAMRPDAVVTQLPLKRGGKGGRPRVRGATLPKPQELAADDKRPWSQCEAELYGKRQKVEYKTFLAQWYRACGARLLRVVVVRVDQGAIKLRVFFCTDPTLSVRQILEGYAGRWAIEVCFRELKQLLGFADSSARKKAAVERVAPLVGYIYSTLVVWLASSALHQASFAAPPLRPWYRHKRGLSFADVLRAAQRVLAPLDVLDPARTLEDLRESPERLRPPRRQAEKRHRPAA
jgi:hypothetical protein